MLADYIENKPVIETKRLLLRPLNKDDIDDLKEWMPDPSMYTYWGKGLSKAEKDPRLMFEKKEKAVKSFHLGIALKESDKVIGDIYVYLIENDRMACIAFRISRKYQGKGYAKESVSAMTKFCFENTQLQRIWTQVDVRNIPSWKVLEKCGYTREGSIRQGKMVNTWCDYYIYAILKEDLEQR